MNTVTKPMDEWKMIPWKKFHKIVFKLQKRIYRASQRNDQRSVQHLQRLLIKSQAAICLAVRAVTQDNRGKKTAGVDGVKALNPAQRLALVKELRHPVPTSPLRRIWIDKPGTTQKRGLAVPTMRDRAEQALIKLAMEPAWEAKFESNSYGFRPGRSAQDAIKAIWYASHNKESYILDADIAKCFDKISHKALLAKLAVAPHLKRQIKSWLVAGVIDQGEFFPTDEGAAQGSPLSPLLMNIALHGMQTTVEAAFPKVKRINGLPTYIGKPKLIRYADDLVVVHRELAVVEQAKQLISDFLAPLGLELKPSKTRITNTLHKHEQNVGLDFLGFTVRQFRAGQTHTGKTNKKEPTRRGFKTLVKPSQKKQTEHLAKIKETTRQYGAKRVDDLIKTLNVMIIGWCNYYAASNAKTTFAKLDHQVWEILWRWAKHRHPHKTKYWIYDHYWPRDKFGVRQFTGKEGTTLYKHSKTRIKLHVKVEGRRSPYDGDWTYWGKRLREYRGLPTRKGKLLKWQMGKCVYCGLYFKDGDLTEVDHIKPIWAGGKNTYINWQLLHRHCHDKKTVEDLALWEKEPPTKPKRGTNDKGQTTEEPDEVNVSSPVLQPSGGGDPIA